MWELNPIIIKCEDWQNYKVGWLVAINQKVHPLTFKLVKNGWVKKSQISWVHFCVQTKNAADNRPIRVFHFNFASNIGTSMRVYIFAIPQLHFGTKLSNLKHPNRAGVCVRPFVRGSTSSQKMHFFIALLFICGEASSALT